MAQRLPLDVPLEVRSLAQGQSAIEWIQRACRHTLVVSACSRLHGHLWLSHVLEVFKDDFSSFVRSKGCGEMRQRFNVEGASRRSQVKLSELSSVTQAGIRQHVGIISKRLLGGGEEVKKVNSPASWRLAAFVKVKCLQTRGGRAKGKGRACDEVWDRIELPWQKSVWKEKGRSFGCGKATGTILGVRADWRQSIRSLVAGGITWERPESWGV